MRFTRISASIVALIALLIAGRWGWAHFIASERDKATALANTEIAAENARREKDIAFYERRSREDPASAGDRASLARLYLQQSRETGDFRDIVRAEQLARESLERRQARNEIAHVTLISSLLAQHRFVEARAAAEALVAESPEVDAFRAILGETCLELGDYPAAKTAFNSVRLGTKEMLNIAPRVSRWLEVNGNLDAAVTIMHRAMLTADSAVKTGVPRELSAWFHLRVGDLEMRRGRLETAEQILAEGRLIVPQDHRLLAAQARLAAMQRDWKRAIALGDSSIAAVLDPITVALVGDAYLALGDSAKAQEYFRTTEVTVAQQPQQFHRALGLFLLDHDRQIDKVAMQAQQDLETRRDIYGYDLLAWARYRQGRISEARALMTQALKTGARDATLLYHAGMIDLASGDKKSAASRLEAALKINPRFDPIQSEVATATLAALRK